LSNRRSNPILYHCVGNLTVYLLENSNLSCVDRHLGYMKKLRRTGSLESTSNREDEGEGFRLRVLTLARGASGIEEISSRIVGATCEDFCGYFFEILEV